MTDTERQTAAGKVLWHFTMSLDGFVAGPNHAMDWMGYAQTTGAVLGGRHTTSSAAGRSRCATSFGPTGTARTTARAPCARAT